MLSSSTDRYHIEKLLGSTLSEYPNEPSDPSYSITHGFLHGFTNDNFEAIELREPTGGGRRTMLILDVRKVSPVTHAVTQKNVIAHFGTGYEPIIPSPHEPDGLYGYKYNLPQGGTVSFEFEKDGLTHDVPIREVIINRTIPSSAYVK